MNMTSSHADDRNDCPATEAPAVAYLATRILLIHCARIDRLLHGGGTERTEYPAHYMG
jgi:hypothetical protein